MDIHELIRDRTSIRKYKTTSIPLETVLRIINSACRAPSGANMQCWRFIIVDDSAQKKVIGEACSQEPIARACEDAPYVIVLCADPRRSVVNNGIDYFLFDCALAMENLLLAARGEGLSTCVVAWFDATKIVRVLSIPADLKLVALTPLGYGDEPIKHTPRKSLSKAVFYNRWGGSVDDN
jgi:nitroreductase